MKTRIITDDIGRVSLSYDESGYDGVRRIDRTFTCPVGGGYVREYRNGDWKQVCDRLSHWGSTLICSTRDGLPAMIRREYQGMRRAEKREAKCNL